MCGVNTSFMLASSSSIIVILSGCSQCFICIASLPVLWFICIISSVNLLDVTSILVSIFISIFLFASSSNTFIIFGPSFTHDKLPEKNSICFFALNNTLSYFSSLCCENSLFCRYAFLFSGDTNWYMSNGEKSSFAFEFIMF